MGGRILSHTLSVFSAIVGLIAEVSAANLVQRSILIESLQRRQLWYWYYLIPFSTTVIDAARQKYIAQVLRVCALSNGAGCKIMIDFG